MSDERAGGITFNVELERPVTPRAGAPKRLQVSPKKSKPLSPEALEEKQRKAEERRKAHEAARLQRIHARQEQCRHINQNVAMLLEQDARRQGIEGENSGNKISRAQTTAAIRAVAKEFGKMGLQIDADLGMPTEKS